MLSYVSSVHVSRSHCTQCSQTRAVLSLAIPSGMADRVGTPRQRARALVVAEIKATARNQLAVVGAAGLSVRHVARDLGLSSSGVYRYFASRDELLTALIIDAYDALGSAAEAAEQAVARDDLLGRWRAASFAVRQWARDNPQEYGLVFGSPVPGYEAPADTVAPAARVPLVLAAILRDAHGAGRTTRRESESSGVLDLALVGAGAPLEGLPDEVVIAGLMAWVELFGIVTFELFGHLVGSVRDFDAFYARAVDRLASSLGLAPGA